MSARIIIFVEGGAKGGLAARCRKGFRTFFEKAGLNGGSFDIKSCGSRNEAIKDFELAISHVKSGEDIFYALLIDSESPISAPIHQLWDHVKGQSGKGWKKPDKASAEHLHFMVECMEAWFFADIQCLEDYFGKEIGIKASPNIETIVKADRKLKEATRRSKKGCYDKGTHSFDLLGQIDPGKVRDASPYARRLIETLLAQAG